MKTARLIKERGVLNLFFPFSHKIMRELNEVYLEQIADGSWETPVSPETISILSKNDFIFSKSLKNWIENNPINENLSLYPFQKEGVTFIEKKNGRALIADEMGLGKTVQAVSWFKKHNDFRPVLIICPASMKINWQREIQRWCGISAQIISGTVPDEIKSEIVIINYDIVYHWFEKLHNERFCVLIIDEAHYIKNNHAKRTKVIKRLCKNIPKIIGLSGTPIENKPVEIYNIVNILNPYIFPNFISFAQEYCGAKKGRYGWDFNGSTNMKKLNLILKETVMIRRKKSDVLKQLPEKQIVKVPLEINNREEYQKAENEFISFLNEKFNSDFTEEIEKELKNFAKRHKIEISDELTDQEIFMLKQEKFKKVSTAPILVQIEVLKQLCIKGKLDSIKDWIDNFIESGEKLVVFTTHTKTVDFLYEKFKSISVKVDGSVTSVQRQKAVDSFQNDSNVKLFIGNIRAAGIGITLTAASNAAMIEFPWSPGELVQAADRIHRITQTKQVTIWNIVGVDTIEDRIIDILKRKEHVINQVLDGKVYAESNILSDLIKSYKY
jgi:SWI/SNF-related matrix-associated actin-dependent regulator 1 of chromatin subfamily A